MKNIKKINTLKIELKYYKEKMDLIQKYKNYNLVLIKILLKLNK